MNLQDAPVGPAIPVSDMDRAREFYEGKLGLSGTEAPDGGRDYECGEGTGLHVFPSESFTGPTGSTQVGFGVRELEAVVDELAARGVPFERYEGADERGIHGGGVAWMRDPDGHLLSLNQL